MGIFFWRVRCRSTVVSTAHNLVELEARRLEGAHLLKRDISNAEVARWPITSWHKSRSVEYGNLWKTTALSVNSRPGRWGGFQAYKKAMQGVVPLVDRARPRASIAQRLRTIKQVPLLIE